MRLPPRLPASLSSPWDNLSRTCLKWGAPGPYVWPVKRQRVAARRSLVLCGSPKRQAASLSFADCGRGAGKLPTRGGGVGRSSSRGRSHSAPAAGSPRSLGAARYAVVEKKKLPLIYHQKSGANGGAVRNFFANIFSCFSSRPERTHGRSSYPRPRPGQSPGRSCRG